MFGKGIEIPDTLWKMGEDSFNEFYNTADPFLVFFSKDDCGGCFRLKPQLKRVVKETEIPVVEIDVTKERDLFEKYKFDGIPVVMLFRDKEELKTWFGYHGRSKYKQVIEKL